MDESDDSLDRAAQLMVLSRGTLKDGTAYYAYVGVKPSRYADFVRTSKAGATLTLEDYGEVLYFAAGSSEPPRAVREEMQRRYGFDEQYGVKLQARLNAAAVAEENQRINDVVAMLKRGKAKDNP